MTLFQYAVHPIPIGELFAAILVLQSCKFAKSRIFLMLCDVHSRESEGKTVMHMYTSMVLNIVQGRADYNVPKVICTYIL